MKLIIQLIVLILTIKQCLALEKLFVNLVPYQTSSCSKGGEVMGIGYSGIIDTCLTIDGESNFKFQLGLNDIITWSTYQAKNLSEVTCTTENQVSSTTSESGSCVSSKLFNINSNLIPVVPFFYEVSYSDTPFIQGNSYVDIYMSGDTCTPDNILVVDYLTSGSFALLSTESGSTIKYLCVDSIPEVSACNQNGQECKTPMNTQTECYNINQFFNGSSYEQPCPPSSSQQGSESCSPLPFSGASAGASSGAVSSGSGFSSGFVSQQSLKTSGSTGVYTNYIVGDSTTGNGNQNNNNLNSMSPYISYFLTTYCSNSN